MNIPTNNRRYRDFIVKMKPKPLTLKQAEFACVILSNKRLLKKMQEIADFSYVFSLLERYVKNEMK